MYLGHLSKEPVFKDPTVRVGCNDVYEGKSVIDFGWVFRLLSSKGLISRDFTVRVAYNDVDKGKSVIWFWLGVQATIK